MRQWVSHCQPGMQMHKPKSSRCCDEDLRCMWQSHLLRRRHETLGWKPRELLFHSSSLSSRQWWSPQSFQAPWDGSPNLCRRMHCRCALAQQAYHSALQKKQSNMLKELTCHLWYTCTWFLKACGTWIPNLRNSSLKIVEKCVKGW